MRIGEYVTVETGSGPVRGVQRDGHLAFLGIPYAADPVAELRFARPQPPRPWERPRDAFAPGPAAPQLPSRLEFINGKPSPSSIAEAGCLTLNVWAPNVIGNAPVLFWVHGGAWTSGSGSWDWYSGARLAAEQGIVVVTFNYRLGPLGYACLPDLRGDDDSGNFGLYDQITALRWVVDNIAAFGGDQDLITVGGQSAGAHSAVLLAGAPATAEHVRRLLIQSGTVGPGLVQSRARGAEAAAVLLDVLGIRAGDAAALRALDAEAIIGAYPEVFARLPGVDGVIPPMGVVEDPNATLDSNLDSVVRPQLDVMAGWTRDEFNAFYLLDPQVAGMSQPAALTALNTRLGASADALYTHYQRRDPQASPAELMAAIIGDQLSAVRMLDLAERRAGAGAATYLYRFDYGPGKYGACHTIDLPFMFDTVDAWADAPMLAGGVPKDVARVTHTYMAAIGSFVRDGRPVLADGSIRWPRYDVSTPSVVTIDVHSGVHAQLGQAERELFHRAEAAIFR